MCVSSELSLIENSDGSIIDVAGKNQAYTVLSAAFCSYLTKGMIACDPKLVFDIVKDPQKRTYYDEMVTVSSVYLCVHALQSHRRKRSTSLDSCQKTQPFRNLGSATLTYCYSRRL